MDELYTVADLVTRARTAVERDFSGDPLFAHAAEMPTRFAKQLVQVFRGGMAIGMDRETAMGAALRCAGDSMPPLRLKIMNAVQKNKGVTADIVKAVQLPRKTVDRTLQELQLLGLLLVEDVPWGHSVRWSYELAEDEGIGEALTLLEYAKLARNVTTPDGLS
jgi:hypothetical protein